MRTVLTLVLTAFLAATWTPAQSRSAADLYQEGVHQEEVKGDLQKAIATYQEVVKRFANDPAVAATALLRLGGCYEKLGKLSDARAAYERITGEFSSQRASAVDAAERLVKLAGLRAVQEGGIVARQVWSSQFAEGSPSPDGRYIPWVDWASKDGSANLVLHDLLTGEDRQITKAPPGGSTAVNPLFTPDGKQLVYAWYDHRADQWELRAIHIDGTNDRRILQTGAYSGPISPDGKLIATQLSQNGAQQIAIGTLATGGIRVLKTVEWRQPQIGNFSSDGRYLVYSIRTRQDSQDRDVFVIAVNGSSESRLVAAPGENRHPFFTPDGHRVVFTSNRSGRWDLWALRVDDGKGTGALEIVKPDIGPVTGMGFSHDGTFFYRQRIDQRDAFEVEIDPLTKKATTAQKRVSERFVHSSSTPVWAPDGQLIAYIARRGQSAITEGADALVVVRESASGKEREFPVFVQQLYFDSLRWFPDGKSLLLVDFGAGARIFRRLDLSSGQIRTLFETPYSNVLSTFIAPDGRSLLYTLSNRANRSEKHVMRYDLETGEHKSVYQINSSFNGPPAFHGFAVSPDGQRMAFLELVKNEVGSVNWRLMLAPLAGGPPREVWRSKDRFVFPQQATWDAAGRGVFLTVADSYFATPKEIWYAPIDGTPPHSIGVADAEIKVSAVHPDGRRIGITAGTSTTEVWTLKNLFSSRGTK